MLPKELIGKTIKSAKIRLREKGYDDIALFITFTDSTKVIITGEYYGYTGKSQSEYPEAIQIKELK